ncbi:MAG: ABC transporter ATP-binding protein [Armatimonadota bacterium]|nr:ABC transporter ATP-binding protein [Armatimonadota bacterium]MDR7439725.1 ABC transporter ATP-binding protein [Armatimonadota bacterium]MDR7563104.1 ABC transporter ATP-binding protein [Armatimonadota bacterium]MDR7600980.1 ABC transporter ATP-binding protein [Armatimonadota bacterium]
MRATPKIRLERVSKRFRLPRGRELLVLDGLDLEVEEGALVSIVGPSGCGKSTLLNILAGLEPVSEGRIWVDGKEVGQSEVRVGYVFQQPRLLSWRTLRGNVLLPLEEMRLPRAEREARADRYLALVGLQEFAHYYPLQVSGGMQQRVAIARALAVEPEVLLADEPFSALDELTARRMREEFVRIWQATGRTVLFVTHSIREAVFLSTRVVVVTRRPARVYLDVPVPVPYPRAYEDDRLFALEKEITREFLRMEERDGPHDVRSAWASRE